MQSCDLKLASMQTSEDEGFEAECFVDRICFILVNLLLGFTTVSLLLLA